MPQIVWKKARFPMYIKCHSVLRQLFLHCFVFAKLLWKIFLWQISSHRKYTDLLSLFLARLQHSTASQLQASGRLKFFLKQKHRAVWLFDLQHSNISVQMNTMQFCFFSGFPNSSKQQTFCELAKPSSFETYVNESRINVKSKMQNAKCAHMQHVTETKFT